MHEDLTATDYDDDYDLSNAILSFYISPPNGEIAYDIVEKATEEALDALHERNPILYDRTMNAIFVAFMRRKDTK